jgi:hypothetical protein
MKLVLFALLLMISIVPAFAQSVISFDVDTTKFVPGEIVELTGIVGTGLEGKTVAVEVNDREGKIILIRTVTSDINGNFSLKFKVPNDVTPGDLNIVTNVEMDGLSFSEEKSVEVTTSSDPVCGTGTILKDGMCIVDTSKTSSKTSEKSSKGGGCLIATATYGSELAPEVQKLRELRDNSLLSTQSGTNFINSFNDVYYLFSPYIADYERENPVFKEMVKIAITPMITSLSILNYVEMDSEAEVLGYGISLIILNGMMYVGIPVLAVMRFRK